MSFLRPSLLRLAGVSFAVGVVAFAGCSSSGTTPVAVTHPTMIRVEPEDFLGSVPCSLEGAGLKRYVATIVDYNYGDGGADGSSEEPASSAGGEGGAVGRGPADARGFAAPSSPPTPCDTGVGFGFVVPGRHYQVLIDGYDTDAIAPRAKGSIEMVPTDVETDPVHTPVIPPRWHTQCARAIATESTIVRADHCDPFEP